MRTLINFRMIAAVIAFCVFAGGAIESQDFSYAGYHSGRDPLPTQTESAVDVRDFGAIGDGEHDDSEAFLKAIASIDRGVVFVPRGRYRITKILRIQNSGIVLRGDGPEHTTLYFPKPLDEIAPDLDRPNAADSRTSFYSWSGGLVWIGGKLGPGHWQQARPLEAGCRRLAKVVGEAKRGDRVLRVSTTVGIEAGQTVMVYQHDTPDNMLANWLYTGDPGDVSNLKGSTYTSLVSRVTAVRDGTIILERPLRVDIRQEWKPEIIAFEPDTIESGVEGLTFEFPSGTYRGHFTEPGFNAVALDHTANCWIRHIVIRNPDSGIFVTGTFNTVDGVVFESERAGNNGLVGHHGIYIEGDDNLFTHFDYRMRFIHDISVSHCAGNVIRAGKGVDLNFDHHERAPYENRWIDIDAGAGTRLWASGGGGNLGRHCGTREVFWNIRAQRAPQPPPADWAAPGIIWAPEERGPYRQ